MWVTFFFFFDQGSGEARQRIKALEEALKLKEEDLAVVNEQNLRRLCSNLLLPCPTRDLFSPCP